MSKLKMKFSSIYHLNISVRLTFNTPWSQLRCPLAWRPRYSCLSFYPPGGEFCFSWLIIFLTGHASLIQTFPVKSQISRCLQMGGEGGRSAGGVSSAAGGGQTLYKAGFLRPAAHWRNTCWSRGLLRMRTLVLLLFLAAASRSVASKCRTFALRSGFILNKVACFCFQDLFHMQSLLFLVSVTIGGIILVHISLLIRWSSFIVGFVGNLQHLHRDSQQPPDR